MIDVECGVKKEHSHTNFLGMKNINYNFRKLSGPKGDGMTFVWETVNFLSSHNMARAPELRALRWTGYVVRMRTDSWLGNFGQRAVARVRGKAEG